MLLGKIEYSTSKSQHAFDKKVDNVHVGISTSISGFVSAGVGVAVRNQLTETKRLKKTDLNIILLSRYMHEFLYFYYFIYFHLFTCIFYVSFYP